MRGSADGVSGKMNSVLSAFKSGSKCDTTRPKPPTKSSSKTSDFPSDYESLRRIREISSNTKMSNLIADDEVDATVVFPAVRPPPIVPGRSSTASVDGSDGKTTGSRRDVFSLPAVHGKKGPEGAKTRMSTHQRNLSLDFRSMGILLPPVSQVTKSTSRKIVTQHHRNRSLDSVLQRIPEVSDFHFHFLSGGKLIKFALNPKYYDKLLKLLNQSQKIIQLNKNQPN